MKPRYSVIQRGGRFYAVNLNKVCLHKGHVHFAIVGFVGGYADANEAWQAIERKMGVAP